ncbi:MAG TPA: SH3 domain-containing protein [Candidatus Scatomonas merdavium]|nr:SH3 domain-containing protein [Candidatus Scatomonas merdavium]
MQKRRSPLPIIICLVIIAAIIGIGGFFINRYTPTDTEMNKNEYYGLTSEEEAALILNGQVLEEKGLVVDGTVYISYSDVWNYLNSGFYWDAQAGQLMLTLPSGTLTWTPEDGSGAVILGSDGNPYISAECVKENSDIDLEIYSEPNRVVARTQWDGVRTATVTETAQVRYRGGPRSEILTEVQAGDTVVFQEDLSDWCQVATSDGYVGYVESSTLTQNEETGLPHETDEKFQYQKISLDHKIVLGWHYVGSQEGNSSLSEVIAGATGLNTISPTWFSLADGQGNLISYADSSYVEQAHAAGLQVWGLLGDVDGSAVNTGSVLSSAEARANIIQQLMQIAAECGMDGINVDFESVREESAPQYLQFLKELCAAAHQQNLIVSTDNFVPTYTGYYKRAEQAKTVDYIIIMGYDEHTASSEEAGSVASLPFVEQGIADTLAEVPAEQVINAVPFYTRGWVETFGSTVPESQTLSMDEADAFVTEHGIETYWDASVGQNVGSVETGDARYSIWLEDEQSIAEKVNLASEYNLAGVAAWRLGFERQSVWSVFEDYVNQG